MYGFLHHHNTRLIFFKKCFAFLTLAILCATKYASAQKPNILFVIADDQSYPYASAYGNKMVATPGFDLVAKQGILFKNAYVTSPGCSPSRASILTGLFPWQIEEAGSHASSFSTQYTCFPDLLKKAGYHIGCTGKGWAPGNWEVSGRKYNPAGPEYNDLTLEPPYSGISKIDYTANFKKFLSERVKGQPFYFWLGTHEPHRPYEEGSWARAGHTLKQAAVPGFLPSADSVKADLLDYAVEISWFDAQLTNCINELKRIGEFDNTIIIVTADNGMSFPYAKANCTDQGIHVPMAVCWGSKIRAGQVLETLVSTIDVAPTVLEAAGVKADRKLSGESMMPLLLGRSKALRATAVYAGRERHSFSRADNLGYPMRSIRSGKYLLVWNMHPERWPAGDAKELTAKGKLNDAYYDIDDGPSKQYLIDHQNDPGVAYYFDKAVGKRPEFELYDIEKDASCLHNIGGNKAYAGALGTLKKLLKEQLRQTGDTRLGSNPEVWETYPRLEGKMRNFPKNPAKP